MKKWLSILMIMTLCLSTAACGSTSSEEAAEPAETTSSEEDDAQQKADEQRALLEAFGGDSFPESVGAFETEDLEGNKVTEAYFGNADVTIVHVWATYCDPCLEEMENLGKMAESLPDNAQVLGIAADVTSADAPEKDIAIQILSDNNVKFPSVIANDDLYPLLSGVIGVPTTFIVDKEGNVVDDPIIGSDVVGYKRMANDYLDSLEY